MFDKQIKQEVADEVARVLSHEEEHIVARIQAERLQTVYALDPKKLHMLVVKDDETAIELKKQIEGFIKEHGLKVIIVSSDDMKVVSF